MTRRAEPKAQRRRARPPLVLGRRAPLLLAAALAVLAALPSLSAPRPKAIRERDKTPKPSRRAPSGPGLPGGKVVFRTADGWDLTAMFSPPAPGRWTFVLLHGVGSRKEEWGALGAVLAQEGNGLLAYDGRGHGESQMKLAETGLSEKTSYRKFRSTGTDNEWNRMALDVEAALAFLAAQGIGRSSTALCGASIGANVLLSHAALDPQIPLVVLLSPGINYRDVLTVNPIRRYGRRPLLIVAAATDAYALQSSQILYQLALPMVGADKLLFLHAPEAHGAPMLDNPAVMDAVAGWLRAEERGESFSLAGSTAPVVLSTAPAVPGSGNGASPGPSAP